MQKLHSVYMAHGACQACLEEQQHTMLSPPILQVSTQATKQLPSGPSFRTQNLPTQTLFLHMHFVHAETLYHTEAGS